MRRFDNEQLKSRLIDIRQDSEYQAIRSDIRKAVRYIERLEYTLNLASMTTEPTSLKPFKGK